MYFFCKKFVVLFIIKTDMFLINIHICEYLYTTKPNHSGIWQKKVVFMYKMVRLLKGFMLQ